MVDRSVPASGTRLPSHVTGDWAPGAVVLSLAIPDDPLGEHLELTGRPDGRRDAEREVTSLAEVLALFSRTLGLLEPRPGPTPPGR